MFRIIILILLTILGIEMQANPNAKRVAENVLEKLYQANGNHVYLKPKIIITQDEKDAALFLRRANIIELSEKIYRVCQSMGKDSLSALAFILGHELAHAYQSDLMATSTSFLTYDRHHSEGVFLEESADVYGVFMAYLAGFRTIPILPELINRVYQSFDLPAKLAGYPSLLERQRTLKKVQVLSTELIRLFEAGNHLLAIGEYELAVSCYEHVENWYKGREIYNNLGVCHALLAMNFSDKNIEPYIFPLEISWNTRMKKPLEQEGGKALNPEEQRKREVYLKKASEYFSIASKMNVKLIAPEINLMCVMILKGQYLQAVDYCFRHELAKRASLEGKNSGSYQKVMLALAIAYAKAKAGTKAIQIWNEIKLKGSDFEAFHAEFNSKVWKKEKGEFLNILECPNIPGTDVLVDGVKLYRPDISGEWLQLLPDSKIQFAISEKPHSLIYTFRRSGSFSSLQRIFYPLIPLNNNIFSSTSLLTNNGYITSCPNSKLSFLMDKSGKLVEWAKFE